MDTSLPTSKTTSWLDRPLSSILPKLTLEHLLIALIIIAAIVSRFYNAGARVMSHDEVNHVVPSYSLYQGNGYSHDPVTHGPLQFHLLAGSYFLFGDSDFASRIPSALFSIVTVAFVLLGFRRYLGKTGSLLAGFFFLISPYMLFYGRYTRNEALVALFGVIMIYAVLRYLEKGNQGTLYLFTVVLALHFCTKETSFIYTAQLLIFLAFLFINDVTRKPWYRPANRDGFILTTMAAVLLVGIALIAGILGGEKDSGGTQVNLSGLNPAVTHAIMLISLGLALAALVIAAVLLLRGLGWATVKNVRSFDLLILTITMILPQLIAFPISIAGWNPLDYSQPGMIRTSFFLVGAVIIAAVLGLLWKPRLWLINMAIFYAIFTVFYTTFFTNGQGFFTGLVGSLGYWLTQQEVNRGSQPWYFFAFLQVPMYEYLPALGTITAIFIGIRKKLFSTMPGISPASQAKEIAQVTQPPLPADEETPSEGEEDPKRLPVLSLLVFWSVSSLIAYTIAGEKMPWLTVHITLPMLLAAGFGFGYLIDSTPFLKLFNKKGLLTFLLLPVFLVSLGAVLGILAGPNRPFAGNTLDQLQTTSTFIFSVLAAGLSGWGLVKLFENWRSGQVVRILYITLVGILAILTARSAYQASFINYDNAMEFLVYAHAARGPKDVFEQVEEISKRTTGGKDIKVAYIGDALYPYWWYFRDYPNKIWQKDELTRDLLDYPVIIGDDEQYSKIQAILKEGYTDYKYKRLVWPMQSYFNMTWQRLWDGIKNPEMRQAIYEIWLNKDYTLYAQLTGNTGLTLENWQPSGNIHLFIKKDVVAQMWNYGTLPSALDATLTDPYEGKYISLTPDLFFGSAGVNNGQFSYPRGIAVAKDGSIYVADSRNHRIQKFSPSGEFLLSWGTFASIDAGTAPGGTFNEPWGIAVGPDGSVFVTDTWNYRVQKFNANGRFLTMWGQAGPADMPDRFWGPRGVTVDKNGWVYITDTGNNRVVIFDGNGNYVSQFGLNGIYQGEFDEPVGLVIDKDGSVYVADTWNQRIQVFEPVEGQNLFQFSREWSLSAWFGQSVNNKPFMAIDSEDHLFVTDPDGFRVLEFDLLGNIIHAWGDNSNGIDGFGSPSGIASDPEGRIWVTDAENNFALRFIVPDMIDILPQNLPALPQSAMPLVYNPNTGLVENGLMIPVYRLDADQKDWVPVISDGIASLMQPNSHPIKDAEGTWYLLSPENTPLFVWDKDLLVWVSTNPN